MDTNAETVIVPQHVRERPASDQGNEVPQPIIESQATEAPVQLSAQDLAARQAQIAQLREMFQQQIKDGAPLESHPEAEVPIRLDSPVLAPTQSPQKANGNTDAFKNFFASFGKVGETVKKVVQAPGKLLKAVGRGIVGFWTAGDSVRTPLGPPQAA